jgi:tetratricopeptide (TPR) repeat protein
MTEARTVRALRFALAQALAQAGASRTVEALTELDQALSENGQDPSDARIQLAAGQLLETTDPGRALERYIQGMDDEPQAIARARALLVRPEGAKSLSSLPPEVVDRAEGAARRNPSSDACLLAAGLLRLRGEYDRALGVLRLAEGGGEAAQDEVVAQTAEILVDLDRVDEAWRLIEGRGLDAQVSSLQLVQAKVHLLRGEFDDVLANVERLEHSGVADQPGFAVIKALSLLGQHRADDALEALRPFTSPEALPAWTVVYLARREYRLAGKASWDLLRAGPANVDALLLRAQIALEAVGSGEAGAGSADQDEEAGAPPHRLSEELDGARRLLAEVVKELDSLDPRSWWWRAQHVIRGADGRYQFFRCELRLARGMTVTVDELDAVDRITTTYLQDAALAMRKAELVEMAEPVRAAEAYTEAGGIFRDRIGDYERSFECARRAYQLDPSLPRAVDYAYGAVNMANLGDVDRTLAAENLRQAIELVEPLAVGAAWDDLRDLVRPIAVLNSRLAELSPDRTIDRSLRAARLCVAALTLAPDNDAYLNAVLAERLGALGMNGAAMVFAHAAYDADSTDSYYAGGVVVAVVNFTGALEEAVPFLERYAELDGSVEWCNSVKLECHLLAGDRSALKKALKGQLAPDGWAVTDAALGSALLKGIPGVTGELGQAFDASVASSPPDRQNAVDLACLLGRREDAQEQFALAATSGNYTRGALDFVRETLEFAVDPGISTEDFLGRALALCASPGDVRRLVNVQLPLLVAVRERLEGSVPAVPVDQRVVDARLEELERGRQQWQTELDQCDDLLSGLTRLWSALRVPGSISVVNEITRSLSRPAADKPLSSIVAGISRAAQDKALAGLPARLVRSIAEGAEGTDAIGRDDLRLAVDDGFEQPLPRRLALALLDDRVGHAKLELLAAALGDGEVERTASELVEAARSAELDVKGWWRLDDRLAAIRTAAGAVQDVIADTRSRLLPVLCDLAGMNTTAPDNSVSYFSFVIGSDFVPADTGPDWDLFRQLIPAMKERILNDTGFIMPGALVRADWRSPDSLRLMIYLRLMEARRLPAHGFIRPATAGESHALHDPLTGSPVVVDHGGNVPAGSWTPLEFLVRHVERFAREHLAELIGPWHVRESAERLGGEVLERVTSDPAPFTKWLQLLREAARAGDMRHTAAIDSRIAEAVLGQAYTAQVRQPT